MGSRTLVLVLQTKERVAATVPATAVLIGGRAARPGERYGSHAHRLAARAAGDAVRLAEDGRGEDRRRGRGRRLGDPRAPGTYTVKVTHGSETFAVPFTIH